MENSSFVPCKEFLPFENMLHRIPSRGNTEIFSNEYLEHTREIGNSRKMCNKNNFRGIAGKKGRRTYKTKIM